MIDVTAELVRGDVFIAGETLLCRVTFVASLTDYSSRKNGGEVGEVLGWASAQIHCQCSVSESRVSIPKPPSANSGRDDTSFVPTRGELGHCAVSTKPKILFCDLKLMPGESRSFLYREVIPADAPQSFKGQTVRYSYKVTIGAQRVNASIKLLKVPFQVLVMDGLSDMSVYSNTSDELTPANPFLQVEQKESCVLDIAMQVLDMMTCRRSPITYNITNQRGKVAKFCLFKQAYRIGEDIVGTFDFSESTIPCVQFLVTLQSEEVVSPECRKRANQPLSIQSYSKHHEFCLHTMSTNMSLPIPLTSYPSFLSDIVSLKWRLHFEFVTSTLPIDDHKSADNPAHSSTWQGPPSLHVETMVWDLPIKVCATNPVQVAFANRSAKESLHQLQF